MSIWALGKSRMDEADAKYKLARAELKAASERLRQLKNAKKEPPFCNFCGKGKNEYMHLIEGKKTSKICDECIFDCMRMLQELIDD